MTTQYNPSRAHALLEIVGKAPPGPWKCSDGKVRAPKSEDFDAAPIAYAHGNKIWKPRIRNAIATLPDLATELRAALAEIEMLQAALDAFGRNASRPVLSSGIGSAGGGSPFQGRQTGRNRPDIPTDAGVPSRGDAVDGSE